MGYPYFNPPYLQKVDKIEEGNYFVPSGGIEPDSVLEIQPEKAKTIKALKLIALGVAIATMILIAMNLLSAGFF